MAALALLLLLPASLVLAHDHHNKATFPRALLDRHLQPASARSHTLFTRQANRVYPRTDVAGPEPLPAWVDAYEAAKAAGLLGDFPVATFVEGRPPSYPASAHAATADPEGICSWTSSTCNATDDLITVPAGLVALSFDDGPQPGSVPLLRFLSEHNEKAMHFMIGSRIVDNPDIFDATVEADGALAVHTWSHPYMTTMTDHQVLGELGWTMQIIYDRTQRVPAFFRPPYGDIDNRVRAIARHVFGMESVIWNYDTLDWCLSDATPGRSACSPGNGPQTIDQLIGELTGMYQLPESQGLMILEHEHQSRAVDAFIRTFPLIRRGGRESCSLADCLNKPWYQNARDNDDEPVALGAGGVANAGGPHVGVVNAVNPTGANTTNSAGSASRNSTRSSASSRPSSTPSSSSTNASASASASDSNASTTSGADILSIGQGLSVAIGAVMLLLG